MLELLIKSIPLAIAGGFIGYLLVRVCHLQEQTNNLINKRWTTLDYLSSIDPHTAKICLDYIDHNRYSLLTREQAIILLDQLEKRIIAIEVKMENK